MEIVIDLVELLFKEQYVSRSDMWRLSQIMVGDTLNSGKKIEKLGMRIYISELWKDGVKIKSGTVTTYTKFLFRSATAILNIFVQMSSEMWEYDLCGSLYFERAINDLLIKFFKLWKEKECTHDVTIIFFSRTCYTAESYDQFPSPLRPFINRNHLNNYYQDFYSVIVKNEKCIDWQPILKKMLITFQTYHETVLKLGNGSNNLGETLNPYNSDAASGNILEMINLSLNVSEKPHLDCNFERTGQLTLIISPGHGIFNVDRNLSIITKERVTEIGLIPHVICLGEPPLCTVPVFKILKRENEFTYGADYIIPFWLNISFYLVHPPELEDKIFITRNHQIKQPESVLKRNNKMGRSHVHSKSLWSIEREHEYSLHGMTPEQYDQNIFTHKKMNPNASAYETDFTYKNDPYNAKNNKDILLLGGEKMYRDNYHTHTASASAFDKVRRSNIKISENPSGYVTVTRGLNRSRKKYNSECCPSAHANGPTEARHLRRTHHSAQEKYVQGRFKISQYATNYLEEYTKIYGTERRGAQDLKVAVKRVRQLLNPFQMHSIPLKLLSTAYHKWNASYNLDKPQQGGGKSYSNQRPSNASLTLENRPSLILGNTTTKPSADVFKFYKKPLTTKSGSKALAEAEVLAQKDFVLIRNKSGDGNVITFQSKSRGKLGPQNLIGSPHTDPKMSQTIDSPVGQAAKKEHTMFSSPLGLNSGGSKQCITEEKVWKPHIKIGLDWRMINHPACLPLTVDYVPDALTLRRDYIVSDYFVLAEVSTDTNEIIGCWDLLNQLLFQRLRFGGQIVKDLNYSLGLGINTSSIKHPFTYFSIGDEYGTPQDLPTAYLLNIGRAYHVLTLSSTLNNTIKITIYKPRHSFQTPCPDPIYNYNLKSPEHDSFQRCRTSFKFERALDDFMWNTLDMYLGGAFTNDLYTNNSLNRPGPFYGPENRLENDGRRTKPILTKGHNTNVKLDPTDVFVNRIRFNKARFLILPNPDRPENVAIKSDKQLQTLKGKSPTSLNFWSKEHHSPYNWYESVKETLETSISKLNLEEQSGQQKLSGVVEAYGSIVNRVANNMAVRPAPPPRNVVARGLTQSFLHFVDSLNRSRKLSVSTTVSSNKKETKPVSPKIKLTSDTFFQEILQGLTASSDLVKVHKASRQRGSQQCNLWYYISYQLISWIYRNVEDMDSITAAAQLCQKLLNTGQLIAYSEIGSERFIVGTHLYALNSRDDKSESSIAKASQEASGKFGVEDDQALYLEVEVPLMYLDPKNEFSLEEPNVESNVDKNVFRQDISIAPWLYKRERVKFSENTPISPPPVTSVGPSVQNAGTNLTPPQSPSQNLVDKVNLHYLTGYRPDVAYELGLEWLSATPNHLMDELIRHWARKAFNLGLHLAPALNDPFSYAKAGCDKDPLRLPVFLPVKKMFTDAYSNIIYQNSVELSNGLKAGHEISAIKLSHFFVDFLDWILCSKFGFIKHLPSTHSLSQNQSPPQQKRYNYFISESATPSKSLEKCEKSDTEWCGHHYTPMGMEYIHFSGGMFLSVEVETQYLEPINHINHYPFQGVLLGFRWSWNFLLTKKWRLPTFSDESLLENTFSDLKTLCIDPQDSRLDNYFHQFSTEIIQGYKDIS